jgi:hypothetical protein
MASYPVTFCAFYEFITQSLFADLPFVSIYLWQNKRIGENGPSLMRHINKRFFSKNEELRNYHVIIGIEMLSKWRHPSIVDRILKSISFPYPT